MRGCLIVSEPIVIMRMDVFTDRPFAGNPAAAVLGADGLSEAQMQAIAAEMNVAGTAFVSASTRADADLRLRTFTPKREVSYSGHTSVGGTHALLEAGRLTGDRVTFDTPGGLLRVEIERQGPGAIIWLEPPLPFCKPFDGPLSHVLEAVRLPAAGLGSWARPALTPEADLLLPVHNLAVLRALQPDMSGLATLGATHQIRGFCTVSLETVEAASRVHSRFFAPHYGIPEDIVTGSVHSSLGVWLLEAGHLAVTADRVIFTAEQGDGLGRPGRLIVELTVTGGHATRVRVGGRAVTVLRGSLHVG
jgi:PhzF family phenazine biosynthesis protein